MNQKNKDVLKILLCFFAAMLFIPNIPVAGSIQGSRNISSSGIIGTVPSDVIPRVTISGTDFIVNDQPYMFRGVNVQFTGLHHPESGCQAITASVFNTYKSWNINVMRVWLNMEMASPSYGTWTQSFFDNYKLVLDLAEERNIYVFVSMMHSYNLSPKFGGTGFPSWMFTDISSVNAGMDMFYKATVQNSSTYSQIKTAIRDYTTKIVELSKDRNVVMGYDIFNEPPYRNIPGYTSISASYFYEALSKYITEVDPYKPQAVEGNFIDSNYKPNIPNLFVAHHGYADHTNAYTLSQMKSYFTNSGYWVQGQRWGVPTTNMEFFLGIQSVCNQYGLDANEVAQWHENYLTAMEQLGISYAILRCEASPFDLHWMGATVKDKILSHFALNEGS